MAKELTTFDYESSRRVADATRRVERFGRGFGGRASVGEATLDEGHFGGGACRIVSSELVTGSKIRWKYTLRPGRYVAPATPGDPPTWVDLEPPEDVEGAGADYWDVVGYNACEMPNTATTGTTTIGTGNSVDAETGAVAGTPCILLPIGDGTIVWARLVAWDDAGNPSFVFDPISNSAEIPVEAGE